MSVTTIYDLKAIAKRPLPSSDQFEEKRHSLRTSNAPNIATVLMPGLSKVIFTWQLSFWVSVPAFGRDLLLRQPAHQQPGHQELARAQVVHLFVCPCLQVQQAAFEAAARDHTGSPLTWLSASISRSCKRGPLSER